MDITLVQKFGTEMIQRMKEDAQKRAAQIGLEFRDADSTYAAIQQIPIATVVCRIKGWETDGRNFWEPGNKKFKACFVPEGENFLVHGGTDHFPPDHEGYSCFELLKHHYTLTNAKTFEVFKKTYPEIKEISKKEWQQKQKKSTTAPSNMSPVLVCLADVEREEVSWLWGSRFPLGKFTIVEGDPGNGKSWLTLRIACEVTRGTPFPAEENSREPARVLLLTAEDGLGDTIRPRLEDMGGDLTKATVLVAVKTKVEDGKNTKIVESQFSLETDLPAVEFALDQGGYALMIIDPLNAYLGPNIDMNKDSDLRSLLTPLSKLAEKYKIAIIAIRHLTKSSRDRAIYRGQGSIAFTAAARVVHLVGLHPTEKGLRVMACNKNNLSPIPKSIAFAITDGGFEWRGETDVTPDMLLAPEVRDESESAVQEVVDFLQGRLSEGARHATDLQEEAKASGISHTTLKRAQQKLGIQPRKEGFGKKGHWMSLLSRETPMIVDSLL